MPGPDGGLGELFRFDGGAAIHLLDTGANFVPRIQPAPAGMEPLKGAMYFFTSGQNFIYFDVEFTASRAENYLSWLLVRGGHAAQNTHIILQKKLILGPGVPRIEEVDRIEFRPEALALTEVENAVQAVGAAGHLDVGPDEGLTILNILRAAHFDTTLLGVAADYANAIELRLQVKFKRSRSVVSIDAEDAARILRNIPEEELRLVGPRGTSSAGNVISTFFSADVEIEDGIIDPRSASDVLRAAYGDFQERGYILP